MKYQEDPNFEEKHCKYCGKRIVNTNPYLFCNIKCEEKHFESLTHQNRPVPRR